MEGWWRALDIAWALPGVSHKHFPLGKNQNPRTFFKNSLEKYWAVCVSWAQSKALFIQAWGEPAYSLLVLKAIEKSWPGTQSSKSPFPFKGGHKKLGDKQQLPQMINPVPHSSTRLQPRGIRPWSKASSVNENMTGYTVMTNRPPPFLNSGRKWFWIKNSVSSQTFNQMNQRNKDWEMYLPQTPFWDRLSHRLDDMFNRDVRNNLNILEFQSKQWGWWPRSTFGKQSILIWKVLKNGADAVQ